MYVHTGVCVQSRCKINLKVLSGPGISEFAFSSQMQFEIGTDLKDLW